MALEIRKGAASASDSAPAIAHAAKYRATEATIDEAQQKINTVLRCLQQENPDIDFAVQRLAEVHAGMGEALRGVHTLRADPESVRAASSHVAETDDAPAPGTRSSAARSTVAPEPAAVAASYPTGRAAVAGAPTTVPGRASGAAGKSAARKSGASSSAKLPAAKSASRVGK